MYPKYVWMAYGWYAQASWTNSKNVNCTEAQLQAVLENGVSVEVFPIPDDEKAATISGMVRNFYITRCSLLIGYLLIIYYLV